MEFEGKRSPRRVGDGVPLLAHKNGLYCSAWPLAPVILATPILFAKHIFCYSSSDFKTSIQHSLFSTVIQITDAQTLSPTHADMNSIYSGLMSGNSTTKTHNRLSVLLGLQFLVMLLRTWIAFIQIFYLMFSRMNIFGSLSVSFILLASSLRSRAHSFKSLILGNFLGDVVLLVLLLVEMHKRAVGTLSAEAFFKLQIGKTAWVVGGWFVLLVVYRGALVMMVLEWRLWGSVVFDVLYM